MPPTPLMPVPAPGNFARRGGQLIYRKVIRLGPD